MQKAGALVPLFALSISVAVVLTGLAMLVVEALHQRKLEQLRVEFVHAHVLEISRGYIQAKGASVEAASVEALYRAPSWKEEK